MVVSISCHMGKGRQMGVFSKVFLTPTLCQFENLKSDVLFNLSNETGGPNDGPKRPHQRRIYRHDISSYVLIQQIIK